MIFQFIQNVLQTLSDKAFSAIKQEKLRSRETLAKDKDKQYNILHKRQARKICQKMNKGDQV